MDAQAFIADFKERVGRPPSQVEMTRELGTPPQTAVRELLRYLKNQTTPTPAEPSLGWLGEKADESWDVEKPNQFRLPENSAKQTEESSAPPDSAGRAVTLGLYAVAAITFVLSIYFTSLWFTSMFNLFIAGAISISMVSYMVLSPQVAMTVRGFVKIPLWLTFAIALVFSMGSTVAGQYNKLTESVDISSVSQRAALDLLRAEEQGLVDAISTYRSQQDFHQRTLESLTSTAEDRMENYQYAATERNKVAELADRISERADRLNALRGEILVEIQAGNIGVAAERDDFYGWLAGLVGLTRQQVEFLIAALPAIFIDIIAALSLNLALRQRSVSDMSYSTRRVRGE